MICIFRVAFYSESMNPLTTSIGIGVCMMQYIPNRYNIVFESTIMNNKDTIWASLGAILSSKRGKFW